MGGVRRLPAPIVVGLAAVLAAVCGGLVARGDKHSLALLGLIVLVSLAAVVVETPLLLFGALLLMLGLFPEDTRGHLLPGLGVWTARVLDFSFAELLLALLCISATLFFTSGAEAAKGIPGWPGLPATMAAGFAVIAVGSSIWFHQLRAGVHVAEPAILLFVSLIVGYWVATAYGTTATLRWLVLASVLLIPEGIYDTLSGNELSYYDASPILLLGFCAIVVAFRMVDLGAWRIPYLVISSLVILLSLRRGAWLGIIATLVITGIWSRRSGFRIALAIGAVCIFGLEIAHPGSALAPIENAVKYTTGAQGREFSTKYREYEMSNAWMNIERNWLGGIGPATDWTLYNSFSARFRPYNFSYLHNSYMWVWLRYGLIGLIAYLGFIGTSAFTLLHRRRYPIECAATGGAVVGVAIAVFTASYLTTTDRWPITVGLIVGIGLAARARFLQSERETAPAGAADEPPRLSVGAPAAALDP